MCVYIYIYRYMKIIKILTDRAKFNRYIVSIKLNICLIMSLINSNSDLLLY